MLQQTCKSLRFTEQGEDDENIGLFSPYAEPNNFVVSNLGPIYFSGPGLKSFYLNPVLIMAATGFIDGGDGMRDAVVKYLHILGED